MSDVEVVLDGATIAAVTERAERPVLRRAFEAEITPGDGRTVDVRIIRYNIPATVADPPKFVPYQEEWAPGVFDEQIHAANRLLANVEHEAGIGGVVARGIAYSSDSDSFYASVRMLSGQDADKTLELVNDGVFGGISLEAFAKKSVRTTSGVVRRVSAHLDKFAFCRRPAFEDSVVLAVREQVILDESLLPTEIDPELIERCRALGVRLPERYKAHPAETGTPALTGTPEDGTRLDGSGIESSEV